MIHFALWCAWIVLLVMVIFMVGGMVLTIGFYILAAPFMLIAWIIDKRKEQ